MGEAKAKKLNAMKKKAAKEENGGMDFFAAYIDARKHLKQNYSEAECSYIFEERVVEDVLEKEGKIVNLYFSDNVKYLLLQLKKYREENNIESPYVFITKYNGAYDKVTTGTLGDWTRKCGEMINVLTLHPHDWRHSGSQLLSLNGCPIEKISELLNHSGLDVTKNHYLRQDKKKIRAEKDKYTTQF